MQEKPCCLCKQSFPATLEYFHRSKVGRHGFHAMCRSCRSSYNKQWSAQNKEHHNALRRKANKSLPPNYKRQWYNQLRMAALTVYAQGNLACLRCEEKTIEFLAIDHIDNNGSAHRKQFTTSIYQWLKNNNYPPGFQVLCHNCNLKKEITRHAESKWQSQSAWRNRVKKEAIHCYSGGKNLCLCCGIADPDMLTIDHIDGVPNEHKGTVLRGGMGLHLWLRQQEWPNGYQVLCANCNWGKRLGFRCHNGIPQDFQLARFKWKNQCVKHGQTGSSEYNAWLRIRKSGEVVDERWHDFVNFFTDLGLRPSLEHGLSRKDPKGIYCKENCYWATQEEQQSNSKRTRHLTYQGRTQSVSQWARELGFDPDTLLMRKNRGWSDEDTLTIPLNGQGVGSPKRPGFTFNGKTQTRTQWAREYGMSITTLHERMTKGMSLEQALLTPADEKKSRARLSQLTSKEA